MPPAAGPCSRGPALPPHRPSPRAGRGQSSSRPVRRPQRQTRSGCPCPVFRAGSAAGRTPPPLPAERRRRRTGWSERRFPPPPRSRLRFPPVCRSQPPPPGRIGRARATVPLPPHPVRRAGRRSPRSAFRNSGPAPPVRPRQPPRRSSPPQSPASAPARKASAHRTARPSLRPAPAGTRSPAAGQAALPPAPGAHRSPAFYRL